MSSIFFQFDLQVPRADHEKWVMLSKRSANHPVDHAKALLHVLDIDIPRQ
jgi:hypothetical protein